MSTHESPRWAGVTMVDYFETQKLEILPRI